MSSAIARAAFATSTSVSLRRSSPLPSSFQSLSRPVLWRSAALRSRRFATPSATVAPATKQVRVRFAPSPTGALHVGGARTALYNWLLARQTKGAFLVRVEDTDVVRSTRESEDMVLEDLTWLGLHWDEGPRVGGDRGPYRQSERSTIYVELADKLVREGKAYPCFCTEEELDRKREEAEREGRPPQYDGTWRDADPEEVKKRIDNGEQYTVRFKVPSGSRVIIDDAVRGKVAWDADSTVGDFIILRSTGVPVYNFCVAVDDALMGVSTVLRAEEHLTNTLRQVLILRALDFETPEYAHCSLILGSDRSKLSKRHGATSVTLFREEGYLPVAMINYLAMLGWNDGTEKEIYTVEELIEVFDIHRITKSPAMFDGDKLRYINGQHLRALPSKELEDLVLAEWKLSGVFNDTLEADSPLAQAAVALVRGSLELVNDANEEMQKAFAYPLDETLASGEADELIGEDGGFNEVASAALRAYDAGELPIGDDGEEHKGKWKKWVKAVGKEYGRKGKRLFHPLRLALTGKMSGPDVGEILQILYLTEKGEAATSFVPLAERMEALRNKLGA
ncbi:Glutamyl-tRNA Synthetase, chloroplast [Chondrus crispus]|uniref:glutamate--tRNA ligase n=1 Tax=Chondrus crispus TaxID=2769 RepID=R7QLJ9_CHOCR|nr:Glutamyl-tRNA Synthetase, chloroplast [Chondrus crispus]CDF38648.1 Glutamyl-tRNA Synthetase, chloroplast [Chondrus crispus]|eukprot:XP_005718553.1 Glutamyl-tRNA Synthetase, chloroplast [Chondrus crispus]